MTDAEHAAQATAELTAMEAALRKTKVGLAGATGSPGPNWSTALSALKRAREHLAKIGSQQPPEDPPRPTLAPQTYNRGSRGQDARYCVQGLAQIRPGVFVDNGGFEYDADGLSLGGRSGDPVPGLKPADEMDDRGPCDPYTKDGRSFPPWPAASYRL